MSGKSGREKSGCGIAVIVILVFSIIVTVLRATWGLLLVLSIASFIAAFVVRKRKAEGKGAESEAGETEDFYTQQCPNCGAQIKVGVSQRTAHCQYCSSSFPADQNPEPVHDGAEHQEEKGLVDKALEDPFKTLLITGAILAVLGLIGLSFSGTSESSEGGQQNSGASVAAPGSSSTAASSSLAAADDSSAASGSSSAVGKSAAAGKTIVLSVGQSAEFGKCTVTVDAPSQASILKPNEGSELQAYILIPMTVTATESMMFSSKGFGLNAISADGAIPDEVPLQAGESFTGNIYLPWKAASTTTVPSLSINPPADEVSYEFGELTASWKVAYPSNEVKAIDQDTAYSTVYRTNVQATATFNRCFELHDGRGYVELYIGESKYSSDKVEIEAEVSADQLGLFQSMKEGDTVTVQGVVGNITCDIDGTKYISKCLCLTDMIVVQ